MHFSLACLSRHAITHALLACTRVPSCCHTCTARLNACQHVSCLLDGRAPSRLLQSTHAFLTHSCLASPPNAPCTPMPFSIASPRGRRMMRRPVIARSGCEQRALKSCPSLPLQRFHSRINHLLPTEHAPCAHRVNTGSCSIPAIICRVLPSAPECSRALPSAPECNELYAIVFLSV